MASRRGTSGCGLLRLAGDGGNLFVRYFRKGPGMNESQGIRIGRIFGIPIYLDYSWVLIFGLVTWVISEQFIKEHPHWTEAEQWGTGVVTSLLFFASVLFHELAHSVVAQRYKIKVLSITLFIFGGLARIGREPATAMQEFNIAIAGPIASGFLSGAFFLLTLAVPDSQMVGALGKYLSGINFL